MEVWKEIFGPYWDLRKSKVKSVIYGKKRDEIHQLKSLRTLSLSSPTTSLSLSSMSSSAQPRPILWRPLFSLTTFAVLVPLSPKLPLFLSLLHSLSFTLVSSLSGLARSTIGSVPTVTRIGPMASEGTDHLGQSLAASHLRRQWLVQRT